MDLLESVRGCTFDDFLLTPQLGVVPSRDPATIDLTTRFTSGVTLRRPLVSANMDTITRAEMATVLAEEGGIAEVSTVKRTQHGVIADPHTIDAGRRIADALQLMEQTDHRSSRSSVRNVDETLGAPWPFGAAQEIRNRCMGCKFGSYWCRRARTIASIAGARRTAFVVHGERRLA